MKNHIFIFIYSFAFLGMLSCADTSSDTSSSSEEISTPTLNLLTDYPPTYADGDINAIIEIPAGTADKWELNKHTGQVEWEMVNNTPRVVNYIGYPGNYGMIPQTLLSKENGGDGDPLDILVLGPPAERGQVLKSKIIGVLYLEDRGEQDDKLIAVSINSPLYHISSMDELQNNYNGITDIIEIWFTNYKGTGKMKSNGFGDKKIALEILSAAMEEFQFKNTNAVNQ